jgi:hypothetical protein
MVRRTLLVLSKACGQKLRYEIAQDLPSLLGKGIRTTCSRLWLALTTFEDLLVFLPALDPLNFGGTGGFENAVFFIKRPWNSTLLCLFQRQATSRTFLLLNEEPIRNQQEYICGFQCCIWNRVTLRRNVRKMLALSG